MRYPSVRNAHIVPQGYLRNFASGEKIEVHTVGKAGSLTRPIKKVAVRPYFYRRERPDGTPIDDVEWSLSHSEDKAAPLLRRLADRWPLPTSDKAVLAEFFAVQALRGPKWRDWWAERTRVFIDEVRNHPEEIAARAADPQRFIDDLAALLSQDTTWALHMLDASRKLASSLGSMHWSLVEFASPWAATSDHPVVIWPISAGARPPQATAPEGFLATLEVRVPVSPTAAVLMTWLDDTDRSQARLRGARHHAASLNAFTVAEAERQWFHAPGSIVPRASGRLLPLGPLLLTNYSSLVAVRSARRQRASEIIQPLVGKPTVEMAFEMVVVN